MTTPPTTSLYERYAASGAESYERHFVPVIGVPFGRRLLQTARLEPGERVLDIACGTGAATRLATEVVGAGNVTGLDANPGMLEVARTASSEAIDWLEAPAEDMPIADGSIDVAICSMGLQFFGDRAQALREVRRVLAPGGRAVFGTPGPTPPLFQAIDAALTDHVGPGASMFVHAVFALHDPDEGRALLEAAELEDVAVEVDSLVLRIPPPADFLWQYVHSTPLAAVLAELDKAERAALEHDVVERCQPFVDGDGMAMEAGVLLLTGHAGGVTDAR